MSFSIDGLISGLNTSSIIDGLVQLQQRQVARLTQQKQTIVGQQTSFKGVEARLLTLRSSLSRLNRSVASVFDARQTTVSDESLLSATAGSGAQVGSFSLKVNSLAAAHQLGSNGFSSGSAAITQGTLEIKVGDRPASTITVDPSNATASGLVSAINSQASDVRASLILDQTSGQYRILIASKHTGTSNSIAITNNLAASSGNALKPDFSGTPVQTAANASITIGSGAGAITASYESNLIDDLVPGVSLNLLKADATREVTIQVSADQEEVVTAVEDFVAEFNDIIKFIDEQSQFIVQSQTAGPLLGNRTVSDIQNQLRAIAIQTVPGLSNSLNRLSRIGVGVDSGGKLTFDSSKLTQALNGELDGVSPRDVQRLFGLAGESTHAGIEFVLGSSRTQASNSNYQVDITQAAEQATYLTGSVTVPITVVEAKKTFSLKLDGQASGDLTLTPGTYTAAEFASHLESVINSATSLGNRKVAVSAEGDKIRITSLSYGSNSKLEEFGGAILEYLGLTGSEAAAGKDVVGRFIVDGQIETAVGTGRLLVGDSENVHTADLQIRVTLTPDQIIASHEGELQVTRGVTSQLDQFLADLLDPENGTIKNGNDSFERRIESFDQSIARVNATAEAKRASLVTQFANLERLLSQLQTTSSFVSGQLANLSSLNNTGRS